MFNPFKHNKVHFNIDNAILSLSIAVLELQDSVKELCEEVDYLVDFLDD